MKNKKETLKKIVEYLNNPDADGGGFWLPVIQRRFVWDEEQIEKLFDSIMRAYPISTLLTWRTDDQVRRRKFIDNYKESLDITNFYVLEDNKVKTLVLDGQQRLQTLLIALKGSYEGKELYFNIMSGEKTTLPEDVKYTFKFKEKVDIALPWIKLKDLVFNLKGTFHISRDLINRFKTEFDRELTEKEEEKIQENVSKIHQAFNTEENISYQELDTIGNPDLYKLDDIVEIFIRANSGGTILGKSDLLFSLLTVSWEEADEEISDLIEELNKTGYKFTRDFILKTCLTLLRKGAMYDVDKFRDESTRRNIIDNWDKIANAIKAVKDYLFSKTLIRSDKALPSYLCLIPLIYFRYHYENQWNKTPGIDDYILRSLIAGSFSRTPDNLIDQCTKAIDAKQAFIVQDIYKLIRERGGRLEITKQTILEQYYGSKNIHLFFSLWYKGFDFNPAFLGNAPQIDHIFPQSLLKSIKEAGSRTLKYKQWDRDQIANLMLLTQEENQQKGDSRPEEWLKNKSPEYLELHLIPPNKNLWKLDSYGRFIKERQKLIVQKFADFILK